MMHLRSLRDTEHVRTRRALYAIALSAVAVRFAFWALTRRTWEDALITVTHSENFALGLGMTHVRIGQGRIHGFTSPLSVLVPLVGDHARVGFGIHFLRIVSALGSGLAVLYAGAIGLHARVRLSPPLVLLWAAFVGWEHHQILWGMAGMETELVTLVLLGSIYYLLDGRRTALGIFLGLCLLARPDFAPWVGLALVSWVVSRGAPWSATFREAGWVLGLILALYVPWLAFTTLHYGSPVPNTIIAKSTGYMIWWQGGPVTAAEVWKQLTGSVFDKLLGTLVPAFGGHGTGFHKVYSWSVPAGRVVGALVLLGMVRSLLPGRRALLPAVGFMVGYGIYYLFLVPAVFGWYVVPYAAVAVGVMASGVQWLCELLTPRAPKAGVLASAGFAAAFVASVVVPLPANFHEEWLIQTGIEDTVRKRIALDLRDVMRPDQTVASESLGYVGYFARRSVYDWPGLCNPQVPAWAKTQPRPERHLLGMARHFRPDFIVLRAHEYDWFLNSSGDDPWFREGYAVLKRYEADPAKVAQMRLGGLNIDKRFIVVRRN